MMLHYIFVLRIAILFAIIVLFGVTMSSVVVKRVESFTSNKTIILLGDSMLENKYYVKEGKSILSFLKESFDKIYSFAVDRTIITGIYQQIKKIPQNLNTKDTYIFLSVGGNDIIERAQSGSTTENIDTIFEDYMKIVELLKTKMFHSKIVLLTLYYPANKDYHLYYGMIKDWNQKLESFALRNEMQVIKTNQILSDPSDFINNIEPSELGGEKLAESIVNVFRVVH